MNEIGEEDTESLPPSKHVPFPEEVEPRRVSDVIIHEPFHIVLIEHGSFLKREVVGVAWEPDGWSKESGEWMYGRHDGDIIVGNGHAAIPFLPGRTVKQAFREAHSEMISAVEEHIERSEQ